ncbi:unnamed protein product [Peniophora sp. CBMAI 1063]|nr:unnamed protein product [Peniophora sp. CBMAI 1063]
MNATTDVAHEHNTLAPIHLRLANEHLHDIFLALSLIDTPSLDRPQGWFLSVNGVCRLWREIALHSAELWARSAGSFPSRRMTDLALARASRFLLRLTGHYEDHEGPGYVLTPYQLSLVESHAKRLRSLVHDDYSDWSGAFYRVRAFPELLTARIWDDSGPDMWNRPIDAPKLQCLYLNNGLVPFNAPQLRYLHVDMDNVTWREERTFSTSDDSPMSDSREAIPRVFPTREIIAALQRSPNLERLIVTNMPELIDEDLPSVQDLHAELSALRGLHMSGNSKATGDLWQRLCVPSEAQVFVDTIPSDFVLFLHKSSILPSMQDLLNSSVYDSVRLSMSPAQDLVFQLWSSEEGGSDGLDFAASLHLTESTPGAAFTIKYSINQGDRLTFEDFLEEESKRLTYDMYRNPDPYIRYLTKVADVFYFRMMHLLQTFDSPTIRNVDLTDYPYGDQRQHVYHGVPSTSDYDKPDASVLHLFRPPDNYHLPQTNLILNWDFLRNLKSRSRSNAPDRLPGFYVSNSVRELTIVNFPCASFPCWKRHDYEYNEKAWDDLCNVCLTSFRYRLKEGVPPLILKLAESSSDMSNMERSEEPVYKHTIPGSYEDAVRAVTEKGYQQIAPFVSDFVDVRIHSWL